MTYIQPLPHNASNMEKQLAKALAQTIDLCRDALTNGNYSEEEFDRYERTMLDAADRLGRLRQHVTARKGANA